MAFRKLSLKVLVNRYFANLSIGILYEFSLGRPYFRELSESDDTSFHCQSPNSAKLSLSGPRILLSHPEI